MDISAEQIRKMLFNPDMHWKHKASAIGIFHAKQAAERAVKIRVLRQGEKTSADEKLPRSWRAGNTAKCKGCSKTTIIEYLKLDYHIFNKNQPEIRNLSKKAALEVLRLGR